ncbi:MAG: hypothetical protein ACK5KT_08510 [Dysgonomonas sp.]
MKKYIFLLFPFLLVGCALLSGKFNKTAYQKADKIIYEEIFDKKKREITDKSTILQIVEILGVSQKDKTPLMAKEQLLFVRQKDTLVVYKNGTTFQDARGLYSISEEADKKLTELLKR